MPRHDRKRWWESKPPPPKPKYYGIVIRTELRAWVYAPKAVIPISHWLKPIYEPALYSPHLVYHIDKKMTLEEAKALCVILNAMEDSDAS